MLSEYRQKNPLEYYAPPDFVDLSEVKKENIQHVTVNPKNAFKKSCGDI